MASARRQKAEYVKIVQSDEHFESFMNEESPKLTIVDAHLTWCGPCTLMQKIF
jgi:hypothetical protein